MQYAECYRNRIHPCALFLFFSAFKSVSSQLQNEIVPKQKPVSIRKTKTELEVSSVVYGIEQIDKCCRKANYTF